MVGWDHRGIPFPIGLTDAARVGAVDDEPIYLLSIADRGTDALLARGVIGHDLAAAPKAEARRRDDESAFFGHISLPEPACPQGLIPCSRAAPHSQAPLMGRSAPVSQRYRVQPDLRVDWLPMKRIGSAQNDGLRTPGCEAYRHAWRTRCGCRALAMDRWWPVCFLGQSRSAKSAG
jgi:hypothetical protein